MLTLHTAAIRHIYAVYFALVLRGYWGLYFLKSIPRPVLSKEYVDFGYQIRFLFRSHFVHGLPREVPQVHWIRMHDAITYGVIYFDPWIRKRFRRLAGGKQAYVGYERYIEAARPPVVDVL